jgi:hypothetical protein
MLTLTGARMLSSGDIVSVLTGCRRFKTRHFGAYVDGVDSFITHDNGANAWKLRLRVLAWR